MGSSLRQQRSNLLTIIFILVCAIAGLLLMVWSANPYAFPGIKWRTPWDVLMATIGSSLLITAIFTTSFDLFTKRSFAAELFELARVGEAINQAGLFTVEQYFQSENIRWSKLFAGERVEIFFIGSSTWRNRVFNDIKKFFSRRHTQMRVFLPNPRNVAVVGELSRRMSFTTEQTRGMIEEAYAFFEHLAAEQNATDRLTLIYVDKVPVFSFFRFDSTTVLSLYSHRTELTAVPTFIVKAPGHVSDFLTNEITALATPGA